MIEPPQQISPDLPDAAAVTLTADERQLVIWLHDPDIDGHEIAQRLLTDADRDPSD